MLLGRIISEQHFAVSVIVPLVRYVLSYVYVILQMDNGPIRATVSPQAHSDVTDTHCHHHAQHPTINLIV